MSELAGVCGRYLVLRNGRSVADVPGEDANEVGLLDIANTGRIH